MKGQIIEYDDARDDDHVEAPEVEELRGASGARILIGERSTTKLDVERTGTFVRSQGEWLSHWATERDVVILPKVTEVFATGYTMETVHVKSLDTMDIIQTCERILHELEENLWCKVASDHLSAAEFIQSHRTYVAQLLRDVEPDRRRRRELDDRLRAFYNVVDWTSLEFGLTHGDAIIDNVGFRARHVHDGAIDVTDQMVILDPIPAKESLPNWRCVDVGRIIQSMIGYEHVRYRRAQRWLLDYDAAVTTTLNWYMPRNFKVNEARASVYFAIIHMLRGVRTTTQGTASRLGLWYLVNRLVKVAETWMR